MFAGTMKGCRVACLLMVRSFAKTVTKLLEDWCKLHVDINC